MSVHGVDAGTHWSRGGRDAGLTAAVALRARGFDVAVFERSERRERQGVALLVWANAMRALASLGVGTELRAAAQPIHVTEIQSAAGEVLCTLPIRDWSQAAEAPTVAMRRPALIAALLAALPESALEVGAPIERFRANGPGVIAQFADGRDVHLDGLVGADGLHSRIREQLLGTETIRTLDQRAWVGIARTRPGLLRPGVTTATIGRGPRFWTAPLDEHEAFWYATLNGVSDHVPDARAHLLAAFCDWHVPIPELIESSLESEIVQARICDRLPVTRWGEGAVTLLGDAAHPSTPDLGQGACQAIEGAVVLADAVARSSTIAAGFRDYESRRMTRTATVSRMCWLTSMNSTVSNPTLCRIRDAGIRFGLRTIARGHVEWMLAGS